MHTVTVKWTGQIENVVKCKILPHILHHFRIISNTFEVFFVIHIIILFCSIALRQFLFIFSNLFQQFLLLLRLQKIKRKVPLLIMYIKTDFQESAPPSFVITNISLQQTCMVTWQPYAALSGWVLVTIGLAWSTKERDATI